MKTSSFKQQVTVHTTPQVIYDLLMDAKKHSALIGSKVKISQKAGGMFEVYDGYAHGENLQLLPGQRIVQTWRANEAKWPKHHFSSIRFELQAIGKGRTRILFHHKHVPADLVENFKSGWREFYWEPLKAMFNT